MNGFVQTDESIDQACSRMFKELTGLETVYLEQLHVFGGNYRDPSKPTISIVYFALADINKYKEQINIDYQAEWFPLKKLPKLIPCQQEMVAMTKERIRYKAARQPLLFELLPTRFTIPQVHDLYENIYNVPIDTHNFSKKLRATGLLIKLDEEDKTSKKDIHYYQLHTRNYYMQFQQSLNFMSSPDQLV